MIDIREADNGTWYVDCPDHGLVVSGAEFYTAAEMARLHDLTQHDG